MANSRMVRLEGEFKRALSEILLFDLKDPRVSEMANITRVSITSDLKYGKVLVSVYDTPVMQESTIEALNKAGGFLRSKLNEKIKIRRIPELTFILDTSIEHSIRISKIIDEAVANIREDENE